MEMLYPVPDKCQGDGGGVHGNGGGGGQGNYLVYGCAPIYTFNLYISGSNKHRLSLGVPPLRKSAQIQQREEIGRATEGGMP